MEENGFIVLLQAMLDKAKSLTNIKKDIESIQSKLKIKIQGTLDKTATQKELKTSLKSVTPKIKVDADTSQAVKKIKKLGQQKITATVKTNVDNSQVMSSLKATQKETKSLFDRFLNSVVGVNLMRMGIQKVTQAIHEAISGMKELDKIKTNIQMVSGTSDSGVDAMMQSYNTMAKDLSSTTKSVAEAANEFLRMGESVSSTNELIKSSQILSKVGMVESADAASYLISSLKGYKMAAEDSIDIVSKLTSVDLEAAVSSGGLAEAMSRCANIADNSGTSMNRLVGYVATVGETTQESMSVIGNSFKSIYSRMNNIKIGKFVDEESGESLSDTETVLNKLGIQLRDTANTYRDFDDVLDDIGNRWSSLTQVEQNAISVAIAGTMHRNRFIALMDNYAQALQYSETAANSAGSALERYGVYQDSIEAKTNELTAAIESLSTSTISEGLYAGIVEATTGLVEFIDKTNILKGTLAGLVTMGISKAFVSMATGMITAAKSTAYLTTVMELFDRGKSKQNLLAIGAACKTLTDQQLRLVLSTKMLKDEERLTILEGMGLEEEERKQMLATLGLASAENTATASTFSLKGAWNALCTALAANPIGFIIMLVSTAVSGLTVFSQLLKQSNEKLIQSTQDAANAQKESATAIDEQITRIKELKESLASGTLTDQEAYQAKSDLYEIQKNLIETYGQEAEGIDLVNGGLERQIGLVNGLSKAGAEKFLNENKTGIEKAEKKMNQVKNYHLGDGMADPQTLPLLQKIADKYKEIVLDARDDGSFTINLKANATQAEDIVNDFATDIRNLQDQVGENNILDGILGFSEDALSRANDVLTKYGDIYNEAQKARLAADDKLYENQGGTANTAAGWLADYAKRVEEYNDALLTDDQDAVGKAERNFDSLDASIRQMTADADGLGVYSAQFEEIREQLNTAAISANKFKEALSGELAGSVKEIEGLRPLDILTMDAENVTQRQAEALEGITEKAMEYGVVTEETEEPLEAIIDLLVEWGVIQGEVTNAAAETAQTIEALSESSVAAQNSITKAREALSAQSTGKGITAEALSSEELRDYADALEYVNGSYRLNTEKTQELIKAKAEEQIAVNDAAKAQKQSDYLTNAKQIEELTAKLRENKFENGENAEAVQSQISGLRESNSAIVDECRQLDVLNASLRESTGAYQEWLNAQNTTETGDMFSDSLNAIQAIRDTMDKKSDDYGRIGTEKYKAAVEFVIPDSVEQDNPEAVRKYLKSVSDMFTRDKDGKIIGMNITNFCDNAVKEGLMNIEAGGDGEKFYNIADGINMEDFAEKLNLSKEMVQAMFGEMQEFGGEFEWPEMDTFGEGLVKTDEAIQSVKARLEELKKEKLDGFEVDDSEIEKLESKLDKLGEKKEQLSNASMANIEVNAQTDKQLKEAKTELEGWRTKLKSDPLNVEVQAKAEEAEQKFNDLQQKKDNLQEPTQIEVRMASESVDAQIAEKKEEMDRLLHDSEYKMRFQISDEEAFARVSEIQSEIAQLTGQKKTIEMYADTDGTMGKLEEVEKFEIEDKDFTVSVLDKATDTLREVKRLLHDIKDKDVKLSVKKETRTSSPTPGSAKAGGTSHAGGTAYPGGKHTALVGELGREIVVDVKTGKWHTVGDNGAEFTEIPSGAIVFNHLQTEELLKRGFVNSRGTALASGNAYADTVRGGIPVKQAAKSAANDKSSKKKSKKAQEDNTRATEDNTKAKEHSTQVFDWVAVKLQYFADKTKKIADTITDYVTLAFKKGRLKDQYSSIDDEIRANRNAAKAYTRKAGRVAKKYTYYNSNGRKGSVSVPQKYKRRVQEGRWSIQDMDTSTDRRKALAEAIQSYQDYYNKAKECEQAVIDLRNEQYGLFEDLMNIPTEKAEQKIDRLNDDLDILGAKYDNLVSVSDKNKNLNQQTKNEEKIRDAYAAAYKETVKNLEDAKKPVNQTSDAALKGLSSKDKKTVAASVKAGDEITISDSWSDKAKKAATEYNIALRANREAYVNAEKAAEEYTRAVRDNARAQFENIQAVYENRQKTFSQRSTEISNAQELNEAMGYRDSSQYYTELAKAEKELRDSLSEEREKLQKKFESAVSSGSIARYSDEWYSMKEQIDNVTNSITESDIALQGFNNSIRDLAWENFEKLQDKISSIADEADFYINELSREDTADDDIGRLTGRGDAAMKLHAVNYETYRLQAQKYAKEAAGINKALAEDPANEVLLDKKEEYIEAQRESIRAAQDEKYAMIDLAKQGYEAQKNYLQKVIDKYKKLLSIQKDADDYQKTISDAAKEINAVQKQLSALSGDDSEAARARRQELAASLKEKQDALKDKQMDKLTSDINDMFDDLMDDYSSHIDGIIKSLSENFGQLIDAVNERSASTTQTILDMSGELGLELHGLKDIFSGSESGNVLSATQTVVKNIEAQQMTLVNKATDIASALLSPGSQNPAGSTSNTAQNTSTSTASTASNDEAKAISNALQAAPWNTGASKPEVLTGQPLHILTDKDSSVDGIKSYIKKHASKAKKKKSEYSDFNKALYDNKAKLYSGSGMVLSSAELKTLAKNLGVAYDGATKDGALYKKFKSLGIKGFASGSHRIPHDQLALTQEKGPEVIMLPDGTMLTPLKEGSKVFDDKMTENLWKISQDEDFMRKIKETNLPKQDMGIHKLAEILNRTVQYGDVVNQNRGPVEVNIGDVEIVLPNVHNRKEFAAEMKEAIKKEPSVRKIIQGVTIDTLGRNHNSLSIMKY